MKKSKEMISLEEELKIWQKEVLDRESFLKDAKNQVSRVEKDIFNLKEKEEASKRPNLNKAFRELRKAGYFARQNFWCCSSCAISAIPEEVKKAVFYHGQDADDLKESGKCFMNWWGDLQEILTILKKNNIKILNEKELDKDTRINISIGDKK